MKTLAILHPTNLLGQEVREGLQRKRELWREIRLFSTLEDEIGSLTEVRGAAAMVEAFEPAALRGVDLAFFCGPVEANRAALEALPPGGTALILSPDAGTSDGRAVVDGINLDGGEEGGAHRGEVLLSPHPAAVGVAHLLQPLRGLGLGSAAATLVQPASMHDQTGLDELFEQTRAVIAFASEKPTAVFGTQLAFNLLPSAQASAHLGPLVRAVLGAELDVSMQVVQGGVFHGFSISLMARFAEDPGTEAVRGALEAHPAIELAEDADLLGPVDAAGRDEVLVGAVRPDAALPGTYWLWAVMDNLTRGGAGNALSIAERVLAAPPVS